MDPQVYAGLTLGRLGIMEAVEVSLRKYKGVRFEGGRWLRP
jgi:hypothetical protein